MVQTLKWEKNKTVIIIKNNVSMPLLILGNDYMFLYLSLLPYSQDPNIEEYRLCLVTITDW